MRLYANMNPDLISSLDGKTYTGNSEIFSLNPKKVEFQMHLDIILAWKSSEPVLLTWIDFNPCMDKWLYIQQIVWWNYLSISKLQRLNGVLE